MPMPLICTNNSFGNIDYGIPIVANKSTDYRTTTGTHHRLIPNQPQEFDCRVKAEILPELFEADIAIKDATNETAYYVDYPVKPSYSDPNQKYGRAKPAQSISYTRTVQEKMFQTPPPPMVPKISEMKDTYRLKYPESKYRTVFPPEPYEKCEIKGIGRDEQPTIPPEEPGFWKWLDPYLTTNRSSHVPFTKDQQNGIGRKDIMTYYDILNYPKAKGFGPRNGPTAEPLVSQRQKPIYDVMVFKKKATNRVIPKTLKRIPNFGMQTESQGNYTKQTFSDLHPYLHSSGVEFPDSLPDASAWENLAPPGMYCTEYCHIGTGWPPCAVIERRPPEKIKIHKPCCTKFLDSSQ